MPHVIRQWRDVSLFFDQIVLQTAVAFSLTVVSWLDKENWLMESTLTLLHDEFFKKLMFRSRLAKEFFQCYLPDEIKQTLNLDSLSLANRNFVDGRLINRHSDMVYQVKYREGPGLFYLLVEHQSSPVSGLPWRVFCYINRLMSDHYKRHETLPQIHPMIFYNGTVKYNQSTALFPAFDRTGAIAKSIYKRPIQLVDISKISDENIKQRPLLGLMEMTMKYVPQKKFIHLIEQLSQLMKKSEGSAIEARRIVYYAMKCMNTDEIWDLIRVLENRNTLEDETMKSLAQGLYEKGYREGETQGEARGEASALGRVAESMAREGVDKAKVAAIMSHMGEKATEESS